jgi:hypothetical protein
MFRRLQSVGACNAQETCFQALATRHRRRSLKSKEVGMQNMGNTQGDQMKCAGCGKDMQNAQNRVEQNGQSYCCQTCADKNAKKM